jgi:hypothetical protein
VIQVALRALELSRSGARVMMHPSGLCWVRQKGERPYRPGACSSKYLGLEMVKGMPNLFAIRIATDRGTPTEEQEE